MSIFKRNRVTLDVRGIHVSRETMDRLESEIPLLAVILSKHDFANWQDRACADYEGRVRPVGIGKATAMIVAHPSFPEVSERCGAPVYVINPHGYCLDAQRLIETWGGISND